MDYQRFQRTVEKRMSTIMARAPHRAGKKAHAVVLKEIAGGKGTLGYVREKKNLPSKRVKSAIDSFTARRSDRIEAMSWRLVIAPRSTPLSWYPFNVRITGHAIGYLKHAAVMVPIQSIRVRIDKGKAPVTFTKPWFTSTMQSGHVAIVRRRGAGRLPLEEAKSSSVYDVLQDAQVVPRLQNAGQSAFSAEFSRLYPLMLSGAVK